MEDRADHYGSTNEKVIDWVMKSFDDCSKKYLGDNEYLGITYSQK
jgi:hypothetical protein